MIDDNVLTVYVCVVMLPLCVLQSVCATAESVRTVWQEAAGVFVIKVGKEIPAP